MFSVIDSPLVVAYASEYRTGILDELVRFSPAVGILGGYTTFSSFSYESLGLLADAGVVPTLLNTFGQLALGLVFVYLGIVAGRLLGGA